MRMFCCTLSCSSIDTCLSSLRIRCSRRWIYDESDCVSDCIYDDGDEVYIVAASSGPTETPLSNLTPDDGERDSDVYVETLLCLLPESCKLYTHMTNVHTTKLTADFHMRNTHATSNTMMTITHASSFTPLVIFFNSTNTKENLRW